jgi:hypothetical protein
MKIYKKHGTKEKLFEMMERVNKIKLNESFDNPNEKDKKYLNKLGDKEAAEEMPNKYDDGYREPRERNIQVKDSSVEKIKGADKPIEEGMFDFLRPESSSSLRSGVGRGPAFGGSAAGVAMAQQGKEAEFRLEKYVNTLRDKGPKSPETKKAAEEYKEISGEYPKGYMGGGPSEGAYMPEGEEMENGEEENVDVDVEDMDIDSLESDAGSEEGEEIEGGLADGESPSKYNPKQILLGMEVEMGHHTNDPKEALEIVMDHLEKDPDYYGDNDEGAEEEAQENAEDDAEKVDDVVLDDENPESIENDDLSVNMNWLETIKPKSVDDIMDMGGEESEEEDLDEGEKKKDSRLEKAGVEGYNKPKRTPNHPTKSHIVVAKEGDKVKTIRFGQQGVSGAGDDPKSPKEKKRQKSFKARHAKNISKGKMSAAYWSDKVKW